MTNECIPLFDAGSAITATASANVTGKRFVNITAALNAASGTLAAVSHAAPGSRALGVSTRDAATGTRLTLEARPGDVLPVTAGGTIAAGAEVEVGTNGQAVTLTTGKASGMALSAATIGNDVYVRIY